MGLAGAAVGLLLTHYNYIPDQPQSPRTLNGLALMLTIIPGVFHAIMGGLMFWYRITNQYYAEMMRRKDLVVAQ
jgi:glycoside/pentoside/hexuronide:cation symporter, GPH family